jgi:hypothetical protein
MPSTTRSSMVPRRWMGKWKILILAVLLARRRLAWCSSRRSSRSRGGTIGAANPRPRPISASLFGMFFIKLPQSRHPERSAAQIYRVTHSPCGAESKDLGGAYFAHAARSVSTTEIRQQDLLRYALDGHEYIFSCTVIVFHPQLCARSLNSRPPGAARWLKSSEQHR